MLELRRKIRSIIFENFQGIEEMEEMLDEERLPNSEVLESVKNKDNFIGTHIWGEKIGDGEDYVVVSYGVQFPIFIWDSKTEEWYENEGEYVYDGNVIDATREHKNLTRPTVDVHMKTEEFMKNKLNSLMKKNGVSSLEHTSVHPGEKN